MNTHIRPSLTLLFALTAALCASCGGGGGGSSSSSAPALQAGAGAVAPAITSQPSAVNVTAPAAATFSVIATGTSPTYRWQLSSDGGTTFVDIAGATFASYTTPATTASDNNKQFRVIVSNSQGNVPSTAAVLSVTAAPAGAPTTELLAFAIGFAGLQMGSALADIPAFASPFTYGAAPTCATGSATVAYGTIYPTGVTFSGCTTAYNPNNAYSGTWTRAGGTGSASGLSVFNASPLNTTFQVADGGAFDGNGGLTGSTLTEYLSTSALNLTVGSHNYLLGTFTVFAPGGSMSRTLSGGVVTTTVPAVQGNVTFDSNTTIGLYATAPIVWQGGGYPTTGSLGLTTSTGTLTLQFLNNGSFRIHGVVTPNVVDVTKNWTDADVQASLRYVIQ